MRLDIDYKSRVVDSILSEKLQTFGAIHIIGPKWCGKTTTAMQQVKSTIQFQKESNKEGLIKTAMIDPYSILDGEKPLLIDEWQDAPPIWDAVRVYCDEHRGRGHFILTGSTAKKVTPSHSGIGRISNLKMYPMSLYESNESTGEISLASLFEKTLTKKSWMSALTLEKLISSACRGGWPESLDLSLNRQLSVAKNYFEGLCNTDIYKVDDVKRNGAVMRAILQTYARNLATLAKTTTLIKDVKGTLSVSENTFNDYLDVLERLFVIEDLYGWAPSIRSASSIRNGRKRMFTDPSIAIAALGISPDFFKYDLKTFGFIFECLCVRDLRVYSTVFNGRLSYYHDRSGLEADIVLHLDDGRYALIECKLGEIDVEEGAKHLCKIESLIREHNEKDSQIQYRLPDLKIILTGTKYGYLRDDGVYVIPIGCLGP